MARSRAADYDDKRRSILKIAAAVFAREGFHGASIATIAAAAEVSKATLYHYYANKDALLFALLQGHLKEVLAALYAAQKSTASPEAQLHAYIVAILEAYRDADDEHRVQIHDMSSLSTNHRNALMALEREIVRLVADCLDLVVPDLLKYREKRQPLAMSLFGILNWHFLWFREQGPMDRKAYADFVMTLFLRGAPRAVNPTP